MKTRLLIGLIAIAAFSGAQTAEVSRPNVNTELPEQTVSTNQTEAPVTDPLNEAIQPTTTPIATTDSRGELGTKKDLVEPKASAPNAPALGGMQILQMAIAIAIVFAILKFGLPKMMEKFGKKISTSLNSAIDLQEAASFGAGSLQVITVRGKTLLLGVTPTGITCLADLSDTESVAANTPAFFDLVDQAKNLDEETLKTKAVVETFEEEPIAKSANPKVKAYQSQSKSQEMTDEELSNDLKARLERLSKLVS